MDLLFEYINNNSEDFNMVVKYSTPEDYVNEIYEKSLQDDTQVIYPLKTDDFFPYADFPNAYWTGYFTSRVTLKKIIKETNKMICKHEI